LPALYVRSLDRRSAFITDAMRLAAGQVPRIATCRA
jgi:hypothetical protein